MAPKLISVVALAVSAVAPATALAEARFEDRGGVLYVTNVETRQSAPPTTRPPRETPTPRSGDAFRHVIAQAAERYALAPELVESVIRVESNFEPRAVSPKGARGLMQLMPATAKLLGVQDMFDVG